MRPACQPYPIVSHVHVSGGGGVSTHPWGKVSTHPGLSTNLLGGVPLGRGVNTEWLTDACENIAYYCITVADGKNY